MPKVNFDTYETEGFFDEMMDENGFDKTTLQPFK